MAIIQISKVKARVGNLVDLPQLDDGELGLAQDVKRVFIGKTTPNENIEILTSYSQINYSQINGSVGNLNINPATAADGQMLVYDGDDWINRGGEAGGLVTLGDVSNVKLTGGAIGYVLETDGLGNLSWTPKSTIITYIENVTKANAAVVTTVADNFLTEGLEVTITDAAGMTQLNGNTYFVNIISSNTFGLYTDSGLTTPLDSSGFTNYAYTSVANTTISTNVIDVGNAAVLTVNTPVRFVGDMSTSGIENDVTYYIKTRDTGANTITISDVLYPNGVAGNVVPLATTTGLTANVYQEGGRVIAAVGGSAGTGGAAGGSNTTVQYNNNNLLDGDADFTFNIGVSPKLLSLNGNANVGNLNASGSVTSSRLFSNVTTGTTPIQVVSTTRVANLNVSYANVADYSVVTTRSSGVYYPLFVDASSSANYILGSNANLSFNAATGNLNTQILNVVGNANVGNMTASGNVNIVNGSGRINLAAEVAGGAISIGRIDGTASTPYIDFNTSATTVDYDVRLQVAGNAGTIGSGTLTITAANANASGNLNITGNITGAAATLTGNVVAGNVYANAGSMGATTITASGNVVAGNVYANSGTVRGTLLTGTLTTAAQPNVTSIGTLTSLTVTGNVTAGNVLSTGTLGGTGATHLGAVLTTGANTTPGTVTGNWTLTAGSRLEATYADLAEYYEGDGVYEPGTVVEFGGAKEVTIASEKSCKVAGVVSDRYAYIMNSNCPGTKVAVALQGRVPCKVIGQGKKGDMMVSAGHGAAKASSSPKIGSVLGKALQDFDGSVDTTIEIAVGRL